MTILEDFLNTGIHLNVTIKQKDWSVIWMCLGCKKDFPKKEIVWYRRGELKLPFCSENCKQKYVKGML